MSSFVGFLRLVQVDGERLVQIRVETADEDAFDELVIEIAEAFEKYAPDQVVVGGRPAEQDADDDDEEPVDPEDS